MLALATVLATLAHGEPAQKGDTTAPVPNSPHCVRVIETVDKVYDLDISPDGSRLVVGLENGHTLVYSLATGEREADLFVSGGWAWDVEFDPTGTRILVVQPLVTRLW